MKHIPICILLLLFALTKAHAQNAYLSLKYDSVVMYDYEPELDEGIVRKGVLHKNIKKSVLLDEETIATLSRKIGDTASYGGNRSICFNPHLGFVYYQKGKIAAYISVCLSCNHLVERPQITAISTVPPGLSKEMRAYFNELLVKHKFSHQLQPGSSFD